MKLVEVFKSPRKADTYLYMDREATYDDLPEALRSTFGEPKHVLSLKLTPERQLARYSGAEILAAIENNGFFLQMPPKDLEDPAC